MNDNHQNDRPVGHHYSHRPEPNTQPRPNGLLTNAKLDAILNKISNRLTSMKKHKRSPMQEEPESWSDQRSDLSQPTYKSAPSRNNRQETDRSAEEHDPMKQVQLGLIYSKGVPNTLLEGNEYFQDFMNLLVDDASQSLKSQELTQDSSSGRTAGKKHQELPPKQIKPESKEVSAHQPSTSNLKQRVHETINKAETALRNFKQNQQIQRMKSSFLGGDR